MLDCACIHCNLRVKLLFAVALVWLVVIVVGCLGCEFGLWVELVLVASACLLCYGGSWYSVWLSLVVGGWLLLAVVGLGVCGLCSVSAVDLLDAVIVNSVGSLLWCYDLC